MLRRYIRPAPDQPRNSPFIHYETRVIEIDEKKQTVLGTGVTIKTLDDLMTSVGWTRQ